MSYASDAAEGDYAEAMAENLLPSEIHAAVGTREGTVRAGERMFTFRTSSEKPHKTVWCHNCDWKVSGNGPGVFPQADEHDCLGRNA